MAVSLVSAWNHLIMAFSVTPPVEEGTTYGEWERSAPHTVRRCRFLFGSSCADIDPWRRKRFFCLFFFIFVLQRLVHCCRYTQYSSLVLANAPNLNPWICSFGSFRSPIWAQVKVQVDLFEFLEQFELFYMRFIFKKSGVTHFIFRFSLHLEIINSIINFLDN